MGVIGMVKNYMEIIVEDILEDMLENADLKCKCEVCKDDIKAMTLNNLKPIYVATEKGVLYTRLKEFSLQFKADVVQEILSSIKKVNNNPSHDL